MKYELHPACSAWPAMPEVELQTLADDIMANGLHDPLTLTPDGLLLDGNNRALACELANIKPTTVVYAGDPVLFSLSKNRQRRHMTRDQIAMVTANLATRTVGNPNLTISSNEPIGIAEAAAAAGVPQTAIKSAKAVLSAGTPEEIAAVRSGEAKLRATADAVRARKASKPREAEEIAKAIRDVTGKFPNEEELAEAAGISPRTSEVVLRVVRHGDKAQGSATQPRFTKAQDAHVAARVKAETDKLKASFDVTVKQKVDEILSRREAHDIETIEQANVLLAAQRGRARLPFTAAEYTSVLLRALHPDTTTPENRMAAFKLVNNKKLVLREEGRIELRGQKLPRSIEEWEAAKAATTASRKRKK